MLIIVSESLFACSCKDQNTVEAEIKYSDAVLVGTILSEKLLTIEDTLKNYTTIISYDILIQDTYKGEITNDTVTIFSGYGSPACGVDLKIGEKYIIYGKTRSYTYEKYNYPKQNNAFWTNICMRTMIYSQDEITEIENVAEQQKILEELQKKLRKHSGG
ncbi:MAG: hypothetical protein AB7G44_14720 [Bacteroidia bacterium]